MKAIFFGIIFLVLSAWATTPAEINCQNFQGKLVKVTTTLKQPQDFEFCYFFGNQGMDAQTLYDGRLSPLSPAANAAYRETLQYDNFACARRGGRTLPALREDGYRIRICQFFDNSAIDETCLEEGVSSAFNQDLNRALGIF